MQSLRDNIFGVSSGYAGAPRIQTGALGDSSVDETQISSQHQLNLVNMGTSHDHFFGAGGALVNGSFNSGCIYGTHMNTDLSNTSVTTVSAGGAHVFSKGLYNCGVSAAHIGCAFQMNTGSEWLNILGGVNMGDYVLGLLIPGDGATIRFVNSTGGIVKLFTQGIS